MLHLRDVQQLDFRAKPVAILQPARQAGVIWEPQAAATVVEASTGYPAHLQLFAHNAWQAAAGPSSITLEDARQGLTRTMVKLEQRTLGSRWERLTDRQLEYLAALTVLGGQTGSDRLAVTLGRTTSELSWIRDQLRKGPVSRGCSYAGSTTPQLFNEPQGPANDLIDAT